MSKYEAEFRIPTRQQYAYINIKINADTVADLISAADDAAVQMVEITTSHSVMYDAANGAKVEIKASTAPPIFDAQEAIESELGGKVVEESAPKADTTKKPWERERPAAPPVPPAPKPAVKSLFG